jgi:hypothetical protein
VELDRREVDHPRRRVLRDRARRRLGQGRLGHRHRDTPRDQGPHLGGLLERHATTGCATLNSKSQATGYLVVSKYALGVPYRVRADYIRGKDTSNLDADSGFLS